jgi:hypothetical protein
MATPQKGHVLKKQGTLLPELTQGSGELSSPRAQELSYFLAEVIKRRGHPLHLANLWNALYFAYDLRFGGFHADQINPERIPRREAEAKTWSLPIGAFVRVHTETVAGDIPCEVIYKEGAHPEAETAGWIPPWLSGAPADTFEEIAGERVAVVRERFVLDRQAFGQELDSLSTKQFDRICKKARWLDEKGHLLIDALYTPEEAELEDVDYYIDYLLKHHRDGLLAYCFDVELSDEELKEALLRSFEAIRELALQAPGIRSWQENYFFSSADYRSRCFNQDRALGESDLERLFRELCKVPKGETRGYAAIGPRIIELLERDGLHPDEEAEIRDCGYARAICCANCFMADKLEIDQADGTLPSGVHLRLDDDWQQGGVWRAEIAEDPSRYALKHIPPLMPLGLGYSGSVSAGLIEELPLEPELIPESQTHLRFALRLRDRELGRLRLTAEALASLAPGKIEVRLRHNGSHELFEDPALEDGVLFGITYPFELYPGIVLHVKVEKDGGVVSVYTKATRERLVASDGTEFDWETDVSVYERELGLKQIPARSRQGAPSLRELVNQAFRTRGFKRDDGSRALTFSELAQVIFGPDWTIEEARALGPVLADMELEKDGADLIWRPRVTSRTRASDRSLLKAKGESRPTGRLRAKVRRHWVRMFLRQGDESYYRPSEQKKREYAEARRRYGMHGILPEELPEGYTWVKPHPRGGRGAESFTEPNGTAAIQLEQDARQLIEESQRPNDLNSQ